MRSTSSPQRHICFLNRGRNNLRGETNTSTTDSCLFNDDVSNTDVKEDEYERCICEGDVRVD